MTAVRKELRRRRRPLGLATMLVALTAVLVFAFAASSTIGLSDFEGNDGNLVVNTGGNHDWDNAPGLSSGQDITPAQQDNAFGQGTKENDVNVTVVTGSIPNSKANLARFAAAGEVINGDTYMYLAWSREDQSGTVNFDFELNRLAQPNLLTPGPKVLNRSVNDTLINYSFQGGSNTPTLTRYHWNGSVWVLDGPISGTCSEGATNSAPVLENLGGRPGVLRPAQQFGEAAINLTCAGIVPPNTCEPFSAAYVKSRSSTSFNSEIKDFIAPIPLSFSNCGKLTIIKHTDPAGLDQDFGYSTTGGLSPSSFTLNDAGTDTIVFDQLLPGTYTVTEDPDPSGFTFQSLNCVGDGGSSSGRTATAVIVANSDITCTYVNQARGSIVIRKVTNDGQGAFDFTSNTLSPAAWTLTTTGPGDAGADSRAFNDLLPGTYDAAETVPAGWNLTSQTCDDGSPVSAIAVGPGETVTCTFVNARQQGAIDILKLRKHAADGPGDHPHAGVTFTVTGGELPSAGISVETDADGHACVSGLVLSSFVGDYTVTETLPAGYHGEDPKTVSVTAEASGCGDPEPEPDADVTFHNTPLTNIVITVDSQVDGGTASTIDCDGTVSGTDPNGDGGQTHNDLEPGTYTCTVVVDP